jgi:hexosaminidase
MRTLLRLVCIITLLFATTIVEAQEVCIIPTPKSAIFEEGKYALAIPAKINIGDKSLMPIVAYLSSYIAITENYNKSDIKLNIDTTLSPEEYRLSVSSLGISLTGGDYGGVFNGITTLLQLLPAEVYAKQGIATTELPYCTIEDAPRYSHRGFMLDVCRTWMDKKAVMEYIDLLAYHKINSLRLHLTDDEAWRIEIKSHPELAEIGGFRGGDSPIWPRYGKWNERWGGYYTQEDMREIIEYARVRNIEIVPEIDLPGHSLCIATMHPEILCNYTPKTSSAFGYDTRSAFCASREENYTLLDDILREVCELFPSQYIHIGGDEVDMSQWKRCPDCQKLMVDNKMSTTSELQRYFMSRLTEILAKYGKLPAVWNEAIDGGELSDQTLVYGWESVKECRESTIQGYQTVVMPGQYFYFDMKQSPREDGHDWAAVFDWTKVYNFTPTSVGFTLYESAYITGFEGSFFSELYASHTPEVPTYLHYMTFPRILALAEIAWIATDERDSNHFYHKMVNHYDRLDAMGVAYRLTTPIVKYENSLLTVTTDDNSDIYYRREPMATEMLYTKPITTNKPAEYSFIARRGKAYSPVAAVNAHFGTITPKFNITSSIPESEKYSFDKAENYGRLARTTRAGDVGDWVMFTFETPVKCRRIKVATGNFQLPRYIFENGYVELSFDGDNFVYIGDLERGMLTIEYPEQPIKAVRITCTSRGNGAEWVSIQPPTIYPIL